MNDKKILETQKRIKATLIRADGSIDSDNLCYQLALIQVELKSKKGN